MSSKLTILLIILVVLGIGAFALKPNQSSDSNDTMIKDEAVVKDDVMTKTIDNPESQATSDIAMETSKADSYQEYDQKSFESQNQTKRVIFFHANWCPTCKAANLEFEKNHDEIPAGVVLFKTDYDSEKDLKKKYNITYQHTFVLVDENGDEITKWNGGGIKELIANTSPSDTVMEK